MRLVLLALASLLSVFASDDADAQPSNDACGAAIVIPAVPYADTRTMTGATAEIDDPEFECAESNFGDDMPSVWYRYTAPQPTSLQIDTFGSAFDTTLAVHEGVCGLFTDLRACNNDDYDVDNGEDESRLMVTLAAGETVYVEVLDRDGSGGTYQLHVTTTPIVQVSRYSERGHRPSVAAAPGGGFMVVWRGRDSVNDDTPVLGRKLAASGLPAGPRFAVSSTPASYPSPSIAASGDDLVAVWRRDPDLVGRRLDATGLPLGGEFVVADGGDYPQVAVDPLGNFLVVWTDDGIRGRLFDALDVPVGASFLVSTATEGFPAHPSVAADGGGNFVVVWDNDEQDGDGYGIFGQRLAGTGMPLGTEFQVNSTTSGSQRYGSVTADADGSFLVAWADSDCFYCVDARGFDATGAPVGPSVRIDDGDAANTSGRPIATSVDADGTFTVAWTDDYRIVSRQVDASGTPVGNLFQVSPFRSGYLYNPAVASAPGGEFVVSWEWSPYGSHYDVMSRLVQPSDAPPCPPAPREDCRLPAFPGKSKLIIKDRTNDASDAVTWKWTRGSATTLDDFGDPLADGTYRFCVYDDHGTILEAAVAEGSTCGVKPCWKAKGAKGFSYTNGQATGDGIKSIVLRTGADGRASVAITGKGAALRGPNLPATAPVRAQLIAGNDVCWENQFDDSQIDVNTPQDLKAVGP